MLKEFHSTNYYGDNMAIVCVGDVNHEEFVSEVESHFSSLSK